MLPEDLVRFARRDWAALAEAKEGEWLRQKRAMTPAEALQLIDVMRCHALAIRPSWPSRAEREGDISTHQRVGQALRAVTRTSR
jgi:hypothetical protein